MTRDLPFDGEDSDAGEQAGDTTYRVASGVARVARAGAFVTGGALVAANGGGAPAHPGWQRLDSLNAGRAHISDPDPDVPSPVVTFPDPAPDSLPTAPQPATHGGQHTVPGIGAHAPGSWIGTPSAEGSGVPYRQPDANGGFVPSEPYYQPEILGGQAPDWSDHVSGQSHGNDLFGLGPQGFSLPGQAGPGFSLPDVGGLLSPGTNPFTLPRVPAAKDTSLAMTEDEQDEAHAFGLPGHGLGPGGHGFGLPGAYGFVAPGMDPLGLQQTSAAPQSSQAVGPVAASDPFDGVGGGHQVGVFLGAASAQLHSSPQVDAGIGPNGAYLHTDTTAEASTERKVAAAAGTTVGDQLDQYSDWLSEGMRLFRVVWRPGVEQQGSAPGGAGLGTSSTAGSGAPNWSTGAASKSGVPSQPGALSLPTAQPIPTALPVPVVPPAPVAAGAPAVGLAPVAATPMQTTIQPDAATSPIANVLTPPPGPSPLTAPAAAVPALFDYLTPPPPVKPIPVPVGPRSVDDSRPSSDPTTVTKTVPSPTVPVDITGTGVTKLPGTGTGSDLGTTGPHATGTKPSTSHEPMTQTSPTTRAPNHIGTTSTPDDDVTVLERTGGVGTGAGIPGRPAPTTQQHDTVDAPTVDALEPTASMPTPPTAPHSAPTVTQAPAPPVGFDPPSVQAPATVPNLPAAPPLEPGRPIAGDLDHTPHLGAYPDLIADHSALTMLTSGLSSALLPEPTETEARLPVHHGLELVVL